MIVNYAYSVVNKLKALLNDDARVVIYDRHVFIVQATAVVCRVIGDFVIFHQIKVSKHICEPCRHLVTETGCSSVLIVINFIQVFALAILFIDI
jgi:hypothetical protein